MSCVQIIKTEERFQNFIKCGKFVVVDFKADWCPPCLQIAQIYENMAEEAEFTDIMFGIVDIDERGTMALTTKEGIRSMPTFIVYKDGNMVKRISGANEANLRKMLRECTDNSKQ